MFLESAALLRAMVVGLTIAGGANVVHGATTRIDFNRLVGKPAYPENYPFGEGYYSHTDPIVVAGVQFAGYTKAISSLDTYIIDSFDPGFDTYTFNGTAFLLLGRDTGKITFPTPVSGFRLDYGLLDEGLGSIDVVIEFSDGAPSRMLTWQVVQHAATFTFQSKHPVRQIELTNESPPLPDFPPYMVIDNFFFRTP